MWQLGQQSMASFKRSAVMGEAFQTLNHSVNSHVRCFLWFCLILDTADPKTQIYLTQRGWHLSPSASLVILIACWLSPLLCQTFFGWFTSANCHFICLYILGCIVTISGGHFFTHILLLLYSWIYYVYYIYIIYYMNSFIHSFSSA